MKSIIFYTSLIMMLLVSTLAFGDIHLTGGGNWGSTEISVWASGSTNFDTDSESGWRMYYTDTAGTFNWSYTLTDCVAATGILMEDESAAATAISQSSVGGPTSDSHSAYASFNETGEYDYQRAGYSSSGPTPNPAGDGESSFDAYTGIYIDVRGLVVASIEEGSGCSAYAQVYSWSTCSMW